MGCSYAINGEEPFISVKSILHSLWNMNMNCEIDHFLLIRIYISNVQMLQHKKSQRKCLAVQLSWLTRLVLSKLRNKVNLAILSCFILLPENCNVASYLNFNIWSVEEGYHVLSCFPYCFMILLNYIVSFYHIFLFIILFYLSYCYHIISYCFIILYNP